MKLTYRQKIKALLWLIPATVIAVYFISVKETVLRAKDCHKLQAELSAAENAPAQISSIIEELTAINALTGDLSAKKQTDPLLEFISGRKKQNNSILVDYLPLHEFRNQQYLIETRIAVMQGSLFALVELLFELEQKFIYGKAMSVNFTSDKNLKTGKKRLLMTIYIQSIKYNLSEEYEKQPLSDLSHSLPSHNN